MATSPSTARTDRLRATRRTRVTLALATAGAAILALLPAGSSYADPGRSLADVQRQVDALNVKVDQAIEAYDQATVALDAARHRTAAAQAKLAREKKQIAKLQRVMGSFAASAYRRGGGDSIVSLVVTSSPQTFLDQASSLDRIAASQSDALISLKIAQHNLSQAELVAHQQLAKQLTIERDLRARKAAIEKDLATEKALLARLQADAAHRAAQRRAAAAAERASRSSFRTPSYNGPASGRAAAAVRFAYAQLGKPYQWGAAGPNSYDCSGLTMRAWQAGGVSLSHSAAAQYGETRHVSQSDIRPGDLLFYGSPIHHVGIYVGNGQMIDAPHTGTVVQFQPAFRSDLVGIGRP